MPAADLREVARQLSFAHAGDAAAFVDSALGVLQGVTSDIGRKYFDVPGIRERQRIRDRDADRIGLFTR